MTWKLSSNIADELLHFYLDVEASFCYEAAGQWHCLPRICAFLSADDVMKTCEDVIFEVTETFQNLWRGSSRFGGNISADRRD